MQEEKKELKPLRIFLSSPGDVGKERSVAEDVVREIDELLGDELNVALRLLRWENLPPCAGNVQETINKKIGPYDIYLGIMAGRFGSPTDKAESGTLEEFKAAYDSWKKKAGVSEIMFYFRDVNICPENAEEARQLYEVMKFREAVSSSLNYKKYKDAQGFERLFRQDLVRVVKDLLLRVKNPDEDTVSANPSTRVIPCEIEKGVDKWKSMKVPSSFIPSELSDDHFFYRYRIQTTDGFIVQNGETRFVQNNFFNLVKDPVRPFDIQIGKTRSQRYAGNPMAVTDLTNLDLGDVKSMYPFIQVEGYKWIRMVLAELSSDEKILEYIHENDSDPQVKMLAAKNPSASSELQKKECIFCKDEFKSQRVLPSGSEKTLIIRNDYPYGPYFHYIAFPERPVHAWQDLELDDVADLNVTIWKFIARSLESPASSPKPAGFFIGLNSSIRHLVLGTHTRTSAGASISHVHKQVWGMAPGSVNLGNHLHKLCESFNGRDSYLSAYLDFLRKEEMVIYEDDNVCLYIPFGQISVHELQIMVKEKGKKDFISLSLAEVVSLSIAETIAIKLLDEIGIHSFNEVVISLPFEKQSEKFSLIMCFVTREVDLAVSELNQLFVVDKYPEDTKAAISIIKDRVIGAVKEKAEGLSSNPIIGNYRER